MKKANLFISMILSLCLCLSSVSVYAADITTSNSLGSSPVELTMESSSFSVSLPLGLLVEVTRDGEIYTATECSIINNSRSPIVVDDVLVQTDSPWVLEEFDAAYYSMPVNTSKLGFQLNTENVGLDGKVALERSNWPVIYGYDEMALDYDANLPAVSEDKETVMGKVIFTIDFWSADSDSFSVDDSVFEVAEVNLTAEEASSIWSYTKNTDSITIKDYLGESSDELDLVVPTTIDELPVTSVYAGCDNITAKSLSVPSGITISNEAFVNLNVDTLVLNDVTLVQGSSTSNCNFRNITANNVFVTDSSICKLSFYGGNIETATFKNTSFAQYSLNNVTIGRLNLLEGCSGSKIAQANSTGTPYSNIETLYVDCDLDERAFYYSCYVTNVIFGPNASSVGSECFASNSALTSITGLSNLKSIGSKAFYGINHIEITEPVKFTDTTIGSYAFTFNESTNYHVSFAFADVTFDNCSISNDAFRYDTFESLNIKDTTIGKYAFADITVNGDMNITGDTVFNSALTFSIHNTSTPSTFGAVYIDCDVAPVNDVSATYARAAFYRCSFDSLTFGPNCNYIEGDMFRLTTIGKLVGLSSVEYVGEKAFYNATIGETID